MDPIVIRMIILVMVIVAINDGVAFYVIKKHPERLTPLNIAGLILVTVLALVLNIWYHILK
jgi:hypothetical protein